MSSWCSPIMIPGCGFPPLPDFQLHFHTFHCRGESPDMWIPGSAEAQALSEAGKDRAFPRQHSHHIAVCQQETLAFIELHPPGAEGPGSLQCPWPQTCDESNIAPTVNGNSYLEEDQYLGGQGQQDVLSQTKLQNADRNSESNTPELLYTTPRSTDFPRPLSSLEDNASKAQINSSSLDSGVHSPDLSGLQRRISGGSFKEKSIRRKIKVYSPEVLGDESLSTPSLESEYLFSKASLQEDQESLTAPRPASPSSEAKDSEPRIHYVLPLEDRRCPESLECGEPAGVEYPPSGAVVPRPSDQERRRFSASELISRLQLSQRKSSFTLKLGKSLSARIASRDRQLPRSLSPSGKPHSKDYDLGRTSNSAPNSPMGSGPVLPSVDKTANRGSIRLSMRKNSIEEEACSPSSFSCPKRLSRFLPNLLLYQEYSDVAINREIQRQQGAEPGGEEEGLGEDVAGEATPPGNLSPASSFRSSWGSAFSLWQDIPDVRTSGTLDTFSNEERKLQEAKFELVTSEASYARSLTIVVDHFMMSRELAECLSAQDRHWLFSKLPEVKDVSERFLQDLEQRLEEDILRFDVCDIVLAHCPALRRVYLPYVTNQAYQEQTYQRLLQENPRFPGILARLEEHPTCQRLPLTSFLILPFQRITRLKMLVENILKRTAPGSRDEDTATKAFNELKKIIKECNSSVQSMKRTEELIHLNKKIHFEGKIFPLISQSRWLVKHGELLEVDTQTMSISGSKFKLPTRPVYLHLFNDCLLLSRRKDMWKFMVFVHAKITELKVQDISQKLQGISGYIFHLQLCEGQLLKHQILLKARTESEKQRWITAMVPSNPETSGDQISENGDIAQVQCIKSYQALEHDELSLEKADVLQAKNITSDGWVEGIRLCDGEQGWFPLTYVEEITSRNARLRNLRENSRIKCATQKLEG
ncbi:rho guanine nucleotide exchange factor 19 isoform X1 [Paramormyrops kingsleyae]|uniref:Rho guanine nucleotide exchange factor 19 n=1 Tax=Paramormyrops kingsleyae TaxID=1676925 RepID=A0A3B3R6M5_9TELE|nr:rho guanine nucleotide exchange factor 19-like isoform X1 [Paramormyrops kingsleyae]